jgi:hypothetical protein
VTAGEARHAGATARRRWPLRIALIAFLSVLTLAAGAHLFLVRYMPLDARAGGPYSVTPTSLVVARDNAHPFEDGTIDQFYVRWAPGRSVQLAFPLTNEGRLPVTILGLGTSNEGGDPLGIRLLGTGTDVRRPSHLTQRGTPFTLGPDETVEMFLALDMRRQVPRGTGAILNTVALRYRAGWVEHEVTLALPQGVYACAGTGCWKGTG